MKKIWLSTSICISLLIFYTSTTLTQDFCVHPNGSGESDLQTALTAGETNGAADIIKVVQGTYNGSFTYQSDEGYSISIKGGYTTGCAGRVINPSNTILDASGESDRVLYLKHTAGGDITIEGFTVQNGNTVDNGGGIFAAADNYGSGSAGAVMIFNNIITGNTAGTTGGGVFASSLPESGTGSDVILTNNIITGNNAVDYDGGGIFIDLYTTDGTLGDIILTNNIISGNTCGSRGGGVYTYSVKYSSSGGPVTLTNNTITGNTALLGGGIYLNMYYNTNNCYNNIIWGNTSNYDIYINGTGSAYGYNNDYSGLIGTWNGGFGNNIDQDPLLTVNYHLKPRSPCIDTGTNTAPSLPASDIDGDDRTIDGNQDNTATADIGADEYIPKGMPSHFLMLLFN